MILWQGTEDVSRPEFPAVDRMGPVYTGRARTAPVLRDRSTASVGVVSENVLVSSLLDGIAIFVAGRELTSG